MSVNHYSRDVQQYTISWQHNQNTATMDTTQPPGNTTTWFRNQNDAVQNDTTTHHHQRESLFEKSLTPSDVGKLNRLVIPKQHAEKYFPLNGSVSSSTAAAETDKGMILNFEDESGKWWRFRYSYWNSSQSYVLTKGWSRYVKEKQLDAGDVVFFQRHLAEGRRHFIGWRRRGEASTSSSAAAAASNGVVHGAFLNTASYSNDLVAYRQLHQVQGSIYANPPYHPEYSHFGASAAAVAQTPTTTVAATAVGSSRTLRLFGVNLECQPPADDHCAQPCSPTGSSRGSANPHLLYSYPPHVPPPNGMSTSLGGDTMSQMGNRRG